MAEAATCTMDVAVLCAIRLYTDLDDILTRRRLGAHTLFDVAILPELMAVTAARLDVAIPRHYQDILERFSLRCQHLGGQWQCTLRYKHDGFMVDSKPMKVKEVPFLELERVFRSDGLHEVETGTAVVLQRMVSRGIVKDGDIDRAVDYISARIPASSASSAASRTHGRLQMQL